MYTANQITDYTIFRLTIEDNKSVVNLKLQKLLYYIQAWHLAFYDKPAFDGKFQAWVHGPVNREIYDRFNPTKYLHSDITGEDILDLKATDGIDPDTKAHIDTILEFYAKYSGTELEIMTHREEPWIAARKGLPDTARCENVIDENLMKSFYKSRLAL